MRPSVVLYLAFALSASCVEKEIQGVGATDTAAEPPPVQAMDTSGTTGTSTEGPSSPTTGTAVPVTTSTTTGSTTEDGQGATGPDTTGAEPTGGAVPPAEG